VLLRPIEKETVVVAGVEPSWQMLRREEEVSHDERHTWAQQEENIAKSGYQEKTRNVSSSAPYNSRTLTIYMESPNTLDMRDSQGPLPPRTTSAATLTKVEFPDVIVDCAAGTILPTNFPIDEFPTKDPFLPWIHDYFVTGSASEVRFVAQNKRRCQTGEGYEYKMKFWGPQMSLFQPVPVKVVNNETNRPEYQLSSPENATAAETRFLCHFHDDMEHSETTVSKFPFNYEFILWRKAKLPMYRETGKDVALFETAQLLFSCPVPDQFRSLLKATSDGEATVRLDVVPVRTPPRHDKILLTQYHVGPTEYASLQQEKGLFPSESYAGHVLPALRDSGRWANLPLCPPHKLPVVQEKPRHKFVICTWTAASYKRRGDATMISDSAARLREWILFHRLVGVSKIYVYDNTELNTTDDVSPLRAIADKFLDFVTYHPWPATVCSNNRPNFRNPGERSSQYQAEASCRERYGSQTEWMAFIDTDEYLVPMRGNETWHSVLNDMERRGKHILKMRSSRGRPRLDLMEVLDDPTACKSASRRKKRLPEEPCVTPRRNETFLRVYNCDYIKPPRPDRFQRAMKQIYRPAFVLSHFVHYSTVTTSMASYYHETRRHTKAITDNDWHDVFLDELTEGTLIHAKSVLPHETMTRTPSCKNASKYSCAVGHVCPDSVEFDDGIHQKNLFHDENGKYCNCWINQHVEKYWVPKLVEALAE
jgi:hypothetical protein